MYINIKTIPILYTIDQNNFCDHKLQKWIGNWSNDAARPDGTRNRHGLV